DTHSLVRKAIRHRMAFLRLDVWKNQLRYLHHHPSYHLAREPYELVVLSYPEQLSEQSYQAFKDCLSYQVMNSAYL
ncbi:hypothetical protein ABLA76_13315, partial [Xenorhabdus sp. SGI240]